MSRLERVTQAFKKEISSIIHDELKDPRLGFVTLTKVELSRDFRLAKVFFSVLGKEEEYKNTQKALDSAAGFIKKLISARIRLRFAPEIIFRQDRSSEYSVRIEEILNQLKEE
jgi:ribosome-binding factor A